MVDPKGAEERLRTALVGRYAIDREIGRGGMATVYLAQDLKHGRRVAIKVLRKEASSPHGPDRFHREIQVTAGFVHPHILPLLDSGTVEGLPYYVMPFVQGESLEERLAREGRLPLEEAVQVACEVADALAHAHRHGLIHRDIKPGNILMEEGHVFLADFGIARPSDPGEMSLTREGRVVGTSHYQSPEHWLEKARVDGRSDLYSLGCVLFEMLAGEPPFRGPSPEAVAGKHLHEPAPPVRLLNPSVPEEVDRIVSRTLAKDPADRFRTAEDFSNELKAVTKSPGTLRDSGKKPGWWTRRGRMTGAAVILAAALALMVGREGLRRAGDVGSLPPDTTRIWVVVGAEADPEGQALDVIQRLSHALERWDEITVSSPPASGGDLTSLAVASGVGRLVRVSVGSAGADYRLNAELLDAGRAGTILGSASILIPRTLEGVDSLFAGLADRLLFRDADASAIVSRSGTTVLSSRHAYLEGVRRLDQGDLAGADSTFCLAVSRDPRHAEAHLLIALTRFWRGLEPPQWRASAQQAALGSGLSEPKRLMVGALLHQAREEYPEACRLWSILTREEPGYFGGWLGEAICLQEDVGVVPDRGSPSRWSFRTSQQDALRKYRQAFQLFPPILASFRNGSYSELRSLFMTTANARRRGLSQGPGNPIWFLAVPAWEGDSLSLVPYPRDAPGIRLSVEARSLEAAVHHQRDLLNDVVLGWVSAFPDDPDANEALAISLSLLGDPQGLDVIRRARSLAGTPAEELRLAGVEAWIQLAFALPQDPDGIREARLLADSVLWAGSAVEALDPLALTALAALTGRAHRAAELVRLPGVAERLGAPPSLRTIGPPLLIYAAMGGPVDSLRALEARVRNGIAEAISPEDREMAGWMWLARPATLAFFEHRMDAVQSLEGAGDWLLDLQAAFAKGDSASLRAGFQELREARRGLLPSSVTLDALLSEVELLVLMGQDGEAMELLDPALRALPQALPNILADPVWAASVVRAAALRATLALTMNDRGAAVQWQDAVKELWSDADAYLQDRVSELDSLFD